MRCIHSVLLAGAVASLFPLVASAQERVEYEISTRLKGQLATPAPYPSGRADDVHRPGFNGRLWVGRPIIGGQSDYAVTEDGQATYGAQENDPSMAYAQIGAAVSPVVPWYVVGGSLNHSLEAARQLWLEERGYTGGVRTFVNDVYLDRYMNGGQAAASEGHSDIEPRATIHLPIDQPRFKSRMHVNATMLPGNAEPRFSWPATAPSGDHSLTRVVTSEETVAAAPAATQVATTTAK